MTTNRNLRPSAIARRPAFSGRRRILLALALTAGCAETGLTEVDPSAPAAQQTEPAPSTPECGQLPATDPNLLLDVGHAQGIERLVRTTDRVLSQDSRRWVLWDVPSGRQLANGPYDTSTRSPASPRQTPDGALVIAADLVGDTLITPGVRSFDVRSARDGRVLATVPLDDRMVTVSGIARDESYVFVATDALLRLYDRTGRVLHERPGSYGKRDVVFAAPGALHRVVSASHAIETVTPSGETRPQLRYEGTFQAFFLDGSHFITRTDAELLVYRIDGTLARKVAITPGDYRSAGGDGRFVWVYANLRRVRVYGLTGDEPVLQFEGIPLTVGRTERAVFNIGSQRIRALDLTGSAPASVDRPTPEWNWSIYSVDEEGQWAVGADGGALHAGTPAADVAPRRLGCGAIDGFASADDALAVATRDGNIRFYALTDGRRTLTHTLPRGPVSEISYADHGRALVVRSRVTVLSDDDSVRVLEVATGKQLSVWTRADLDPSGRAYHQNIAAAAHADVLARQICETVAGREQLCTLRVARLDGSELLSTPKYALESPSENIFSLSPDGRHFAYPRPNADDSSSEVAIFEDGKQVAVVEQARSSLWLDDGRVLIGHIHPTHRGTVLHLADTRGTTSRVLSANGVPEAMHGFSPDYYSVNGNVYRLADDKRVWSYADTLGTTYSITNPHTVIVGKQVGLAGSHRVFLTPLP